MTDYASSNEALAILGTAQAGNVPSTVDPAQLLSNIRIVSKEVDNKFPPANPPRWPMFAPYLGTRHIRVDGQNVNSVENTLRFNSPLLRLDAVVLNGQSYTIPSQVTTFPDPNYSPWYALQWVNWCMPFWYGCCKWPIFIDITGVWGFSSDYANAWLAVDALTAPVSVTTSPSTLSVSNANATDIYGLPYRIAPGHLLQIDSEWMEVLSVSGSTTVTVLRGVNGSTADTHLINATVSRWQVEEPVKRAVARQAGLMYARFGAYTTMDSNGLGTPIKYPNHWLDEVGALLAGYQYD